MSDSPAIQADDVSRIIMLVFGAMETGGQYWCYVAIKPSRYDEFQKAMASKQYNIQKFPEDGFGEVIVSGDGVAPPPAVTAQVAEIFNIPIRDLFANADPKALISKKIEELSKKDGN